MRNKLFMVIFIITFGLLVGCSEEASLDPVSIDENVDSCDVCSMGILDVDAATQVIMEDGDPKMYDDIGCMITDLQQNKDMAIGKIYVHDYNSNDWIEFDNATFIQDEATPTPMSYGIIAFESQEEAESFQKENGGDIYTKDQIIEIDIQALKQEDGHAEHHDHMSEDDE